MSPPTTLIWGKMINEQWVLIADSTKAFFSLTAQLPHQDMSGDDQAHLGAAHAEKKVCYWVFLFPT